MSQSLYGPTARSPEPSPPEIDDPGMVDPQDLDAEGRRAWVDAVDDDTRRELLLQLMGEVDALQARAKLLERLLTNLLDTRQAEAKAIHAARNATDNFYRSDDYLDRATNAMVAASSAEIEARAALAKAAP